MQTPTFDQLLEATCHFGHLKRKWNPAMAPYIFMERNGIHIIDLYKTQAKLEEAANALKNIAKSGKKVLFVATKKQAKQVVADRATSVGMPYVIERWPGGMRAKLEKNLGSIADLNRLPSALFVVDVLKEHIAVAEANRLGIPVFGIVDTNSDPDTVDFVIPANDDASKSIDLILATVCQAITEGLEERKVEDIDKGAIEDKEAADGEEAPKPRRTRVRRRIEEVPAADEPKAAEEAPAAEEPKAEE